MSRLSHFHFDADPFPAGHNNYFYPSRSQTRAAEGISTLMRVHPGLYMLTGDEGTGKTTTLKRILKQVGNNDLVFEIHATERTDIPKTMAEILSTRHKKKFDADGAAKEIARSYRRGQNVVIAVDSAENLNEAQLATLNRMLEESGHLRLILAGDTQITTLLKSKSMPRFRKKLAAKYRLRPLSTIAGVRYIDSLAVAALSLSQYKKALGLAPAAMISFSSNRNMRNINAVASSAIDIAFEEGSPKIATRHAWRAICRNSRAVRENIYLKSRKSFGFLVAALCCYFLIKLVADRQLTMQVLEVRESLEKQEKQLEAAATSK